MNVFQKIIEKLEKYPAYSFGVSLANAKDYIKVNDLMSILQEVAEEHNNGWIPCSKRLPECENKYGWVSCIVSVIRSHYPTSPYDICDSPYDENIVMHANYNVSQKIWHLQCDEQLNALINIEDAPLNGDYVIAWQPLPEPYRPRVAQSSQEQLKVAAEQNATGWKKSVMRTFTNTEESNYG